MSYVPNQSLRAACVEGRHFRLPPTSRGVSLIEILVGIVIGLIGMLVIFQTISAWDARTRVSTSSGDAQIAGSLAMFNLERDLRLAGMGFGTAGAAGAGLHRQRLRQQRERWRREFHAPTGQHRRRRPDGRARHHRGVLRQLAFLRASCSSFPAPPRNQLTAAPSKYGFKRGDVAVITDTANNCRLLQITDDPVGDDYTLVFATGNYTDFYTNALTPVRWNSAAASMPAISAGNLYNLGPAPRDDLWSVDPDHRRRLRYVNSMDATNPAQFFGVAEGVIDLKAQYGYDADGDKQITDAEWTKVPPVDWTRVRAIRVALLVRGRDYAAPPASDPEAPNFISAQRRRTLTERGTSPMKNVDGTPDSDVRPSPNNWRYYRYRVYEKVIPLRNMIWGQ